MYGIFCCKKKMKNGIRDSILDFVGNTPLVKLNKIPKDHGIQCKIYAKCEFLNPCGSIKDRIALAMLRDAQENNLVHENTTLVEPTSGNTGIGIAFNCALSGNKCIIVTEQKNSCEKVNTIRLLGAEVIQVKNNEEELKIAHKLKDDYPNHYMLNQVCMLGDRSANCESILTMILVHYFKGDNKNLKFTYLDDVIVSLSYLAVSLEQCLVHKNIKFENPVNPKTHYDTTGTEIVSALDNIDMVVMGAGTGGTLTGVGRKVKEHFPNCKIISAEPSGSIMMNEKGKAHDYLVEGIGGTWTPKVLDKSVVDEVEVAHDKESFLMARELCRKEGLLCGGSSGTAMVCAIKAIKRLNLGPHHNVVVILPDGIRNYMSKFVSEQWMESNMFMDPPHHTMNWWTSPITVLSPKQTFIKIQQYFTCAQALDLMKDAQNYAIVVDNHCWFVGVISKDSLRNSATNPVKLPGNNSEKFNFNDPVIDHLAANVHTLPKNGRKGMPTIGRLSRILDITPFVVVGTICHDQVHFSATSIITGDDVLDYIYARFD